MARRRPAVPSTDVAFVVEEVVTRVFRGGIPGLGQDGAEVIPAQSADRIAFVVRERGPDCLVGMGFEEVTDRCNNLTPSRVRTVKVEWPQEGR